MAQHQRRAVVLPNLIRKLRKQFATGRRHFGVTLWLLIDLVRLLRWRMGMIGIFGIAAVGCKFLAAGLLYLFVDALSGQGERLVAVPVLGFELDLHAFFVAGVIAGTLLMMASTAMQFTIRRMAAIAAALFEERCVRRVLAAASRLPHPAIRMNGEMVRRADMMTILGGARSCNLIARQVVQLTPSIISLAASVLVLIWIDPLLTGMLMLAFLGVILMQYPMTNRSVRASDASEIDRRAAMSDIRGFVDRLDAISAGIGHNHGALDKLFGRGSAFQQDIKTFTRRIDGMILGDLTARLGNHAILAGLFIFIGGQILAGARDWASFAAYVAIARMMMKDFQVAGKIFGQIGRLFLPVERYKQFIQAAAAIPAGMSVQNAGAPVRLDLRDAQQQPVDIALLPGKVVLVLRPRTANGSLSEIYAHTTGRIPPAVIDDSLLDASASIRINLTLEEGCAPEPIQAFVEALAPPGAKLHWPAGWLDQPFRALHAQDAWLLASLKAAAAQIHGRSGLIVDGGFLLELPATWLSACAERFRLGPVIIVANLLHHLPAGDDSHVIVADGDRLQWLVRHTEVTDLLQRLEQRDAAAPADKADDDALMMM